MTLVDVLVWMLGLGGVGAVAFIAGWATCNEQARDHAHHIDPEGNVHVLFSPHVDRDLRRNEREHPAPHHNIAT